MSTDDTADYFTDNAFAGNEPDPWNDVGDFERPIDGEEDKPKNKNAEQGFVAYDDSGEPDFAGWLTAQAQAKAKKPLPKGLTKKSDTSRGSSETSGVRGSIQAHTKAPAVASAVKKAPVVTKQVDTKPKEENLDDDGWGDGWD